MRLPSSAAEAGRAEGAMAAGLLPSAGALVAPLLLGLVLLSIGPAPARALHNVTAELFGAEAWGTLAAFGDLNSDKQTDLFVLRESQCLRALLCLPLPVYPRPLLPVTLPLAFPSLGTLLLSSSSLTTFPFPSFYQPRVLAQSPHVLTMSPQTLGTHQSPFTQ